MKKILASVLTAAMMLSMGTAVLADDPTGEGSGTNTESADIITKDNQDLSGVINKDTKFTKAYLINNGTAPAEDFEFEATFKYFKNNEGTVTTTTKQPTVTLGKASFESKTENTKEYTADATVSISNYTDAEIGVYVYEITEKVPAPKTAGVNYTATPVYLVLTILRDEESKNNYVAAIHYTEDITTSDKIGSTQNTYDAGKLTVTKEIEGNMADMNKKFKFTVTLTAAEGTTIEDNIPLVDISLAGTAKDYNGDENIPEGDQNSLSYSVEDGVYTYEFYLGDGQSFVIDNLPASIIYTVAEEKENYTSDGGVFSDTAESKTIAANDEDTVTFTNTLTSEVDTGISVDSIPYIAMLGVVAIGGTGFIVSKKRRSED